MALLESLRIYDNLKAEADRLPIVEGELSAAREQITQLEKDLETEKSNREDDKKEFEKRLDKKDGELEDYQKEVRRLEEDMREMEEEMENNPTSTRIKQYVQKLHEEIRFLQEDNDLLKDRLKATTLREPQVDWRTGLSKEEA